MKYGKGRQISQNGSKECPSEQGLSRHEVYSSFLTDLERKISLERLSPKAVLETLYNRNDSAQKPAPFPLDLPLFSPERQKGEAVRYLHDIGGVDEIYALSTSLASVPEENPKFFELHLSAKVLEVLANGFFAEKEAGAVVLGPREASLVYQAIYKDNETGLDRGEKMIKGVSYPDGLVVRRREGALEITHVLETTMHINIDENRQAGKPDYVRRKYLGLINAQQDAPEIFAKDCALDVISPAESSSYSTLAALVENTKRWGEMQNMDMSVLHIVGLPIEYKVVRNYITDYIRQYRPNPHAATLDEIQIYAKSAYPRNERSVARRSSSHN